MINEGDGEVVDDYIEEQKEGRKGAVLNVLLIVFFVVAPCGYALYYSVGIEFGSDRVELTEPSVEVASDLIHSDMGRGDVTEYRNAAVDLSSSERANWQDFLASNTRRLRQDFRTEIDFCHGSTILRDLNLVDSRWDELFAVCSELNRAINEIERAESRNQDRSIDYDEQQRKVRDLERQIDELRAAYQEASQQHVVGDERTRQVIETLTEAQRQLRQERSTLRRMQEPDLIEVDPLEDRRDEVLREFERTLRRLGQDTDESSSSPNSNPGEESSDEFVDCSEPPALKGVPTGSDSFELNGSGHQKNEFRYFNFGDAIVTSHGEGHFWAIQIWGLNSCGLWIRESSHDGYLVGAPEISEGEYRAIDAEDDGTWRFEERNEEILEISQMSSDRFRVELLVHIRPSRGE